MSYESRAYDKPGGDGFGPDPVVVLVVTGTHDISRLLGLFARGNSEQIQVGERVQRQVRRHNGSRAALALLRAHGGPDFTAEPDPCAGLKVGDTMPMRHVGSCSGVLSDDELFCVRAQGHPGQHIASTTAGKIVAVWPQDGAS